MAKFSVYFVLDNEKLEGKCKLCISPTIIKFSRSSKTNLKTHIETVHRLTSPEEKASAIGSQVIQQAFTGPAIFHAQQAITDIDAVVDIGKNASTFCGKAPFLEGSAHGFKWEV